MSVIVLLIFASLAIATLFLLGFIWAVCSGQYDDTSTPSMRMLMDDPQAPRPSVDRAIHPEVGLLDAGPTLLPPSSGKIQSACPIISVSTVDSSV